MKSIAYTVLTFYAVMAMCMFAITNLADQAYWDALFIIAIIISIFVTGIVFLLSIKKELIQDEH